MSTYFKPRRASREPRSWVQPVLVNETTEVSIVRDGSRTRWHPRRALVVSLRCSRRAESKRTKARDEKDKATAYPQSLPTQAAIPLLRPTDGVVGSHDVRSAALPRDTSCSVDNTFIYPEGTGAPNSARRRRPG